MMKIKNVCGDFYYSLRNIIRWVPVIWKDRDFDYAFLLAIMKFKMECMVKCFEKYNYHTGSEKNIKDMKICITLLQRMLDDNYYEHNKRTEKLFGCENRIKFMFEIEKYDSVYFGKLFGKHLKGWWE